MVERVSDTLLYAAQSPLTGVGGVRENARADA